MTNKKRFRDGSEKVSIKQFITLNIRAIKILHKLRPGMLIIACAESTLWAVFPMLTLFLSSLVLSELSGERDVNRIILYVALAIGSGFFVSLFSSTLNYTREKLGGSGQFWERREMLFNYHNASIDFPFVEDPQVTALLADIHAKNAANALGLWRLTWVIPWLIQSIVAFIAAAVILSGMFFIPQGDSFISSHLMLVLLLAVSVFVPTIAGILLIKRELGLAQTLFRNLAKHNTLWQYYAGTYTSRPEGGLDVRIFKLTEPIMNAIKKSRTWFKLGWSKVESQNQGINAGIGAVLSVLAFLIIGLRALEGMYDIGEVTRFVGGVTSFSISMSGLMNAFVNLWSNSPYLGMTFDYLDLPKPQNEGKLKRPDSLEFEFHNVTFKYPSVKSEDDSIKPVKYALKNVNLKLKKGERLAIVGMNGSGKTTMIKLLCRLYQPTEGKITLNGIDINEYEYNEYLSIFAIVFQDFSLMGQPLGQNLAVNIEYDPVRAEDALGKVGFGERLKQLPYGLDTAIQKNYDETGITMSGGEMQKIALARAIYKDAPFVILDEPTAALDPIAEFEIYSKFNELLGEKGEKTAVFISHRLSSCKFCDEVAVFHEGEIIERGTHDTLVTNKKGKYNEMWYAQAQYYG